MLKVQLRLENVVSLYEGRGVNVLKVHQQLRLKDVVSLHEEQRVNALKVHQKLRLRDGGWSL